MVFELFSSSIKSYANDAINFASNKCNDFKNVATCHWSNISDNGLNLWNSVSSGNISGMISDGLKFSSALSSAGNWASSITSNLLGYSSSSAGTPISSSSQTLATRAKSQGAGALKASVSETPVSAVADSYVQNLATVFKELKDQQRSDLRVSLRVAPLQSPDTGDASIIERMQYVLGNYASDVNGSTVTKLNNLTGSKGTSTLYGFLFEALSKNCGLVFPYTPTVSFNQRVKYETTDIFQSNLSLQNYAGTPVPTISLSAKFTADTKENAKYMLSAIWFLKAVTKSDFGIEAAAGDKRMAGTPPPVLYLNGYGDYIMNYIPVVVSGYSYTFNDDKDYTNIMFNLANAVKFVEYFSNDTLNSQANKNASSIYTIRNMLPIQLDIKIDLLVQPNIYQYTHNFNLQSFKQGNIHIKNNPVKSTTAPQYSLADSYKRSGWTW